MRRALAGALLAFGAGCGSSPPLSAPALAVAPGATVAATRPPAPVAPASPDAGSAESRHARLVERMLRRVEAARGLAEKRAVPGVSLDRNALIAQVKAHVARELPPAAIRDEGLELALFGFLPTAFDYEGAEYELLQDQLAGYYEPADGTMYLADDLGDDEANATLAHELVHALQDQSWNLGERSKYRPGDGDRSEAVSALAEGDATSAMFDVMIAKMAPGSGRTAIDMPDEVFGQQLEAGLASGPGAHAPHVMRSSLIAPYIYGTIFVHALRRQGGWPAVDRAWNDPPTTSEQILHVDKWVAHEPPLRVAAPTYAALGAGWKVSDEDSEGELGVRLAFGEWMDAKAAADLSAGWGGDRGILLTSGDRVAFAWRLRYDAGRTKDERVRRVWPALVRALDLKAGAPKVANATFICRERADRGPFAIARSGGDMIVVLGPATVAPTGWASAGDCALARAWTREIAAAP